MAIKQVLAWIFMFSFAEILAQDPVFSQYFAAPLQINPAFAGVTDAPRISLNYRNQWPSWPNAYRTYAIGFEQSLPDGAGGIGFQALTDDAGNGIYRTMEFHGMYSYHLKINKQLFMKFGIEAGLLQSRVAWDQLVFGDQLDPVTGSSPDGPMSGELRPENLRTSVADIGTGLIIHTEKAYIGLSVRHLNRPDENFISANEGLRLGRPVRLALHSGVQIGFGEGNNLKYPAFISPNLLVVRQADFLQVNAGAYLSYQVLFAGAWYRHTGSGPDAAIALIGVREGIFRFGYSYDMTLSSLGAQRTGGSHEISLMLSFAEAQSRQNKRKSARYNDCFQMFR